ncbi:MAG: hypothetical protein D6691_08190 [Candidatus Hydrogenedentota bacterium]|nr:MAG: hypothetical protein D6691_08190 [Candidatus Hydrogenedentota bacterium]
MILHPPVLLVEVRYWATFPWSYLELPFRNLLSPAPENSVIVACAQIMPHAFLEPEKRGPLFPVTIW